MWNEVSMLTVFTVILLAMTALLGFAYVLSKKVFRCRRPGEPPIVHGSLLLGSASHFSQHAVRFLHAASKRYGDVFTIRLINQYITVIMDPHSYDAVSKERNFDFDPIQRQVNKNVFCYVLLDAKKMLLATKKTIAGDIMLDALENFARNLSIACDRMAEGSGEIKQVCGTEQSVGLRKFSSLTIFDAIFNTIYGRNDDHNFSSALAYENFETFHDYFNYLWLGVPIGLFPKAAKAQREMLCMPDSDELLSRPDLSVYMRRALQFMREHGQTEQDMKGHNLVYLHVNYNTFRLAFWVLYNLLEDKKAMEALKAELERLMKNRSEKDANCRCVGIRELESLTILDSIVQESCRLASGVFVVRYVSEDTNFSTASGEKFLMRKGDRVAMYPPAIHMDPEIFCDTLVFKYDRFVDAKFYKAGRELRHPVMGFGTLCPGKRYALLQLKWFILTVVTRFDLSLQPGQRAEYDSSYYGHEILPPVSDVQIQYSMARDCDPPPRLSFSTRQSSVDDSLWPER